MPGKIAKPVEVFVSYASGDSAFAAKIAATLANQGVRVFFSKKSIRGAQAWHDEIGAALARCEWFVVVLSKRAVASRWVKQELVYALQQRRYHERIVPLLYKTCRAEKLSWTLASIQHIDFRRNFQTAAEQTLRAMASARTPFESAPELIRFAIMAESGRVAQVDRASAF